MRHFRQQRQLKKGIAKNLAKPSTYSESLKSPGGGGGGGGAYFNDYMNWREIEEFEELVWKSPAARIAGQLMGSVTATFYHEHVLVKDPGTAASTPWHHDQSYYPVDGQDVCSLWIPVDPVPREAAVRFVRGSHKMGWFTPRKFATKLNYEKEKDDNAGGDSTHEFKDVPIGDIESGKFGPSLSWATQPGDVIAFYGKTLHGAPGNSSLQRSRRVVSLRFFGDDAVFARRPWKTSPPYDGALHAGQAMRGDPLFPVVWKR